MANFRLIQRRVDALEPGKSAHDNRDTDPGGFGAQILPSGRKRFLYTPKNNGRRERMSIGDTGTLPVLGARAAAQIPSVRTTEEWRALLHGESLGRNAVRRRRGGGFPPLRPKLETGTANCSDIADTFLHATERNAVVREPSRLVQRLRSPGAMRQLPSGHPHRSELESLHGLDNSGPDLDGSSSLDFRKIPVDQHDSRFRAGLDM